jgi:rhodanese-related sulfurtransferase
MAPFPLPLTALLGHWGAYVVYFLLGFAFGWVLEIAGFGNSNKLAAQFYLTEMTVLKVMFTGIIVAMVLVFAASGIGLLDYNLVYVNTTYLVPGIVGGLLMGVGFIIGGFCPGTSLVAAATLKVDGIFFVLGVFFGIFMFGETVGFYEGFWNSTNMGRFTLPELFNVSTGVVVIGVVLMALVMFWFAEQSERIFGGVDLKTAPRWRYGAAGTLAFMSIGVMVIGQPTTADRWARLAPEKEPMLEERTYQIHPGELYDLIQNSRVNVVMLDVRSESDYNLFHILDARHVPVFAIPEAVPELIQEPGNTAYIVMSNDEVAATEAWKILVAESVPNVYILGGGVNAWIETFAEEEFVAQYASFTPVEDRLDFMFDTALGSRHPVANPHIEHGEEPEYESKVVLQSKRAASSGGCG